MEVMTTFLPKTNGLTGLARLEARSDKGRVFSMSKTYPPLSVVTDCEWADGNVYEIGQTIGGETATFAGGNANTVYRTRWQARRDDDDGWENGPWTEHANTPITIEATIPKPGQVRFVTQARGEMGEYRAIDTENSFAPIRTVPFHEFGTLAVTVNDISYDYATAPALTILMNDPIPVVVSATGMTASPTYSWSARNEYPLMVGTPNSASTLLTFPQAGPVTVTCTLRDENTEEINTSVVINFFVVDALS